MKATTIYINISENWGDMESATVENYRAQAEAFGVHVEIAERDDGIYVDGEQVAEAVG